jgi:formyltetrahydrofolate hydrolase
LPLIMTVRTRNVRVLGQLADVRPAAVAGPKRLAILASHEDRCLTELLARCRDGEIDAEVVLVLSDHNDLRDAVEAFGVRYHRVRLDRERRPVGEIDALRRLRGACDLVVLAGFEPGVSTTFLHRVGVPVMAQRTSRAGYLTVEGAHAPVDRDLARAVEWHCDDRRSGSRTSDFLR